MAYASLALAAAVPLVLVFVELVRTRSPVTSFTIETLLGLLAPIGVFGGLSVASLVLRRKAMRIAGKNREISRLTRGALGLAIFALVCSVSYAVYTASSALLQALFGGVR